MRTRLVIVFLVPLVALMLTLGAAAGWSTARSIQQSFYASQIGDLSYFVTSARQGLLSGSTTVFQGEAARFEEVYGIDVAVFDAAGGLWASGSDSTRVSSADQVERVRLALSGRRAEPPVPTFPWVVTDTPLVEPVFDDGDVIGAVLIAADADQPRAEIGQQALILVVVAATAIGLGVLLVLLLARWVLAPVRRLDDAMVAIERGEMHARVSEDTGPPELRRMTRVFNGMAAEIEKTVARQREFALNASHELRNPLNALLLRVEHLATGLGPEWDADVEETREEGRRMTRILETLLGLARKSRVEAAFSAVDLTTLAARRADAWRDVAAQRGVTFRTAAETAVMSATDRMVVESALDAVIDNAVKFSPVGGVIEIGADRDDDLCRITVRDHGPGLPEDQIDLATDRFWRSASTEDVPGTGLGLAIATDLLAAIDGALEVAPADGGGLRVTLVLRGGEAS